MIVFGDLTETKAIVEFFKNKIYKFNKHLFTCTICQPFGSKKALQLSGNNRKV